jgi:hypothetical protein
MGSPSHLVKCFIGAHGEQQTRIKNKGHRGVVLFKCARFDDGKKCQCCDCGSEKKTLTFTAADIKNNGICQVCENPAKSLTPPVQNWPKDTVAFTSGEVHQILFRLPLGLKYDMSAFKLSIVVNGNFSHTWDSDPMVGFMDGAGTVWVGQRGDNGMWFSIGKYHVSSVEEPEEPSSDRNGKGLRTQPSRNEHGDGDGAVAAAMGAHSRGASKVGLFDPHVLEYKKKGSRSSKFGMKFFQSDVGKGMSEVIMDNDLTDHGGQFDETGRWKKRGWKTTGKASELFLVAFRDDHDEMYGFRDVTVSYEKIAAGEEGEEEEEGFGAEGGAADVDLSNSFEDEPDGSSI